MFKLVIQDDEGKTTIVPLIRDEITIGRKEGNTIRLTERNVSRRHARILRNNGEVHIEDLGSYNGIRVNNARIAERVSLRVSDQVQIGDYKLYLKAEGEQADESRTVPVERVEQLQAPQAHALEAATAPVANGTAPLAIHQAATAPQLVGNPNRTLVAISDTDPAGRAIGPATAAAVAALTATGGYGKLVVLSSNFAGKELELSRPQMIIGRTDENDIVINHRSISRNHAKLVRETETGRYTISDLQSSNGVRVNGQDYGKVELRRGDVVDLGHVRLRFVDAGEDFVFARDAIITDVPDASTRRTTVVALLAAIIVVVVGIVAYSMRGSVSTDKPNVVTAGSGTDVAMVIDALPPHVAISDLPRPDLPPAVDAGAAAKLDDNLRRIEARCLEDMGKRAWQQLTDCAFELSAAGNKEAAAKYTATASEETTNDRRAAEIRAAINTNLRIAQASLRAFKVDSVYHREVSEAFRKADAAQTADFRNRAAALAAKHDCTGLARLLGVVNGIGTENAVAAVSQTKCTERVAAADPGTTKPPVRPVVAPGSALPTPTPAKACDGVDVDALIAQAAYQYGNNFAGSALTLITKALGCRQETRMHRLAAMYACGAKDLANAKLYFAKVPLALQAPIEQRCQQEGLELRGP
jgi:ABC transport system ATP-binding/permease protein